MNRDILVTGGRGKTGREVVRLLLDVPGTRVRSGTSRPVENAPGSAAVAFSWHDRRTWRAATAGVDSIFLVRPDLHDAPELVAGLVAQAPRAHVVLLSEQAPGALDRESWPIRVERALAAAEMRTVLRPTWFNQVFTDPRFYLDSIRVDSRLRLPSGGAPIAWVDARDIAAVAVAALLDPAAHHEAVHTVTGPQALTVPDVATAFTWLTGRRVDAEDPPVGHELQGLDQWLVDILTDMYGRVRAGYFGHVTATVAELTGKPARTLEDFIRENAAVWASPGLAGRGPAGSAAPRPIS